EMKTKGFPELAAHYTMLDARNHVALTGALKFKHNYNYINRAAMYKWFNKHLQLGHKEPIVEQDYERLTREEMTVWNDEHPKPQGGLVFEKKLTGWLAKDANMKLTELIPKDKASLKEFKRVVGSGIAAVIGRGLPDPKHIEYDQAYKNDHDTFLEMAGLLTHKLPDGKREQLPILFLYPKDWNKQVVIWISDDGKDGVDYEDDLIAELLDEGTCVIGVDLLYQGEFLGPDEVVSKTRRVKNPREAAAYTFGYNHSLFARRVHDILTVVGYVKEHGLMPEEIVVVGLDGSSGPLVAAARAQAGEAIDRAAINTDGFRFGEVDDLHSVNFLPGGAKYFDLPGMLAVAAPAKTWLAGEEANTTPIAEAYRAAGAEKNLKSFEGRTRGVKARQRMLASVVLWILR
ncbi:MAG: hypothetical protein MI757_08580, partial [Pirellulales bacterium]|nr:hypothetical protein [Pirellulales bacterium]